MILVTWRKPGEPEQSREYTDERLQELMDRANATFGNPALILDGPSTKTESEFGLQLIQKRRRKK